jgi:hypothetical protein
MVHHKGRGRENKTSAVHIDHRYNAFHTIRIPVFRPGKRRSDRPIRVGLVYLVIPFRFSMALWISTVSFGSAPD